MKQIRNRFLPALLTLAFLLGSMTVYAKTGATGYEIAYPFPDVENYPEKAESYVTDATYASFCSQRGNQKSLTGLNGYYEVDGQVAYFKWSIRVLNAMTPDNLYFIDTNGVAYLNSPENQETIAAVMAQSEKEYQAQTEQLRSTLETQYGIKIDSTFSTKEGIKTISDALSVYPEGSVQIISKATAKYTGRTLTISQDTSEGVVLYGSEPTAIYTSSNNRIKFNYGVEEATLAHEMGHGIEGVLNSYSGGELRNTFATLNGGVGYSQYYYYSGDDAIYDSYSDVTCFCNRYAATSYAEDFAETFIDVMCTTSAELAEDQISGKISAAYFQKVLYVKQLFNEYAGTEVLQ